VIAPGLIIICGLAISALVGTGGARAGVAAQARLVAAANDSAEAARTVERFHQGLAQGDSAVVLGLLTRTATILESGGIESVAQYRAHHLPADIEYAQAVKGVRAPTQVAVRGDAAWAVGTSTVRGTFRGRPINSVGAELMVLTRAPDGWRIAAIHWSSRKGNP
jgi:ketosteroid isomerase-like protein